MAINTNQTFKPGQKLTPEQLKQMLALAQNPQRSGSVDGKFGAQITFDPRQVQRGTSVGADAETMADPSGAGRYLISQPRNVSSMGSSDVTDVWDQDGNYLGTSTGGTDLRGLANLAATAVGGAYASGAFSGAEAGLGGGLSGLDAAAIDMGAGATNVGSQLATTAGTTAAGTGAATLGSEAAIDAAIANGGLSSTVADVGLNAGLGTLSPEMLTAAGTIAAEGGIGTLATGAATTTAADALKTGNDVKNGVDLVKAGTGIVGAVVAGDALSDPVDTSKWDQLFDNMLSEQNLASQRGRDLWADYTTTFKPAQQKFVDTAMNFDTAPRRESAAQDASGRVAASYDEQRMSAQREMERAGVDPSTIYALGVSSRLNQAKDEAAAENNARTDVEKTGLNLLKGVVDQGNQVVNQSTQQSNIVTGTTQAASNLLTQQGNIQNQNTQNRNGMISQLLGTGAYLYGLNDKPETKTTDPNASTFTSSKKSKDRGGKVDGLAAVKAVEKSPAEHWRYKVGSGDRNTKQRMGPMAEDLKKVAPAVSDGKKVDTISMLGMHHAAIGGLSAQLSRIEKKIGGLSDVNSGGRRAHG